MLNLIISLGNAVDKIIEQNFRGKDVAIRAISLADHPGKSLEEMIALIRETGTDKYDPDRKSFWQEFDVYKNKGIEMFATKVKVEKNFHFMHEVFGDFFEGTVEDRGYAVKLDVVILYDPAKLQNIPIEHSQNDIEECAWKFLVPDKKAEALLGVIVLKSE